MTKDQAISIAKAVALKEGWPWVEPIGATKERPFVIFGRPWWHVMSNAGMRGGNVNVHIDDKTGEIRGKGFAPR